MSLSKIILQDLGFLAVLAAISLGGGMASKTVGAFSAPASLKTQLNKNSPTEEISMASLAQFKEQVGKSRVAIFDARPGIFYKLGHVPGARSLPRVELEKAPQREDLLREEKQRLTSQKIERVLVYCSEPSCPDSRYVAGQLIKAGWSRDRIQVFEGGWSEWKRANLPIERE